MEKIVIKNKENINQTLFVDFFKSSKNDILPEIDLKSDNIPKKFYKRNELCLFICI